MQTLPKGSCGASILAALVFIGILAAVTIGIQFGALDFAPIARSSVPQVAAVNCFPFNNKPKPYCYDTKWGFSTPTDASGNPIEVKSKDDIPKEGIQQRCDPGYINKVAIINGKIIQLTDKPIQCFKKDPSRGWVGVPNSPAECRQMEKMDSCRVLACAIQNGKEKCQVVKDFDADAKDEKSTYDELKKNPSTAGLMQFMRETNPAGYKNIFGAMNDSDQQRILSAYEQEVVYKQGQIDENNATIDGIQKYIDKCDADIETCGSAYRQNLVDQQKQLEDDNKKLQEQMDKLKESQVSLTSNTDPSGIPCDQPGADQEACRKNAGVQGPYQGPCPSGTEVDPNTGKCPEAYQGPCQFGSMDPSSGRCGYCPDGSLPVVGGCKPECGPNDSYGQSGCVRRANCPLAIVDPCRDTGQIYDSQVTCLCVGNPTRCPAGMRLVNGECKSDACGIWCGDGQVIDSATCSCKPDPRRQCPAGTIGSPPQCYPSNTNPGGQYPGQNKAQGQGQNPFGEMMKALGKALGQQQQPRPQTPPSQQCSTDSNVYAEQQQQYQQQLQQYNYQLQQYNYQQQLNQYNAQYYGQTPPPPMQMPMQPQGCTPSTGQQCQAQPQQPPAANCTSGSWRATYSGVCIVGWQCVPKDAGAPKAEISCQPDVADVGMSIAISFSCSSGTAKGGGFDTGGSSSGSASATIQRPPQGSNTATYNLTCDNNGQTAGAQCSIQIGIPSIILVANPKTVNQGSESLIGWITTGMKSCVISSPDQQDFTDRNASNTSPNGTAKTSPIKKNSDFTLRCETLAGGTRDATVSVAAAR
ncbi:MAG: hypothetical protein RLZZ416_313 [Candidatus Parcubacteria bacterium]|jgi:hypothetical protein